MSKDLQLSIDEAKADMWIENVENEIEIAESILRDISRDCYQNNVHETDTILKGISDVAQTAENVWNEVFNAFHTVSGNLRGIINSLKEAVQKAQEVLDQAIDVFTK